MSLLRECVEDDPSPSEMSKQIDLLMQEVEDTFQRTDGQVLTHRANSERVSMLIKCIDFTHDYCKHVAKMIEDLAKQCTDLELFVTSLPSQPKEQRRRQRAVDENVSNVATVPNVGDVGNFRLLSEEADIVDTRVNSFPEVTYRMAPPSELSEYEPYPCELMLHTLKSDGSVEPLLKKSQLWTNSLEHQAMLSDFSEEDDNDSIFSSEHNSDQDLIPSMDLDMTLRPEVDSLLEVSDSILRPIENQLEPDQSLSNVDNTLEENPNIRYRSQAQTPVNDLTVAHDFLQAPSIADKENNFVPSFVERLLKNNRNNYSKMQRKKEHPVLRDAQIDTHGQAINQPSLLDNDGDLLGDISTTLQDFDRQPSSPFRDMNDERDPSDDESEEEQSQFPSQRIVYEELDVRKHEITILEMLGTQPSELLDGEVSLDVTNQCSQMSRIGDDGLPVLSFKDLVRGRSRSETCRLFTASLFMATNQNIDIKNVEVQTHSKTPCPLTTDFDLVLKSRVLPLSDINAKLQDLTQGSHPEEYPHLNPRVTSTPKRNRLPHQFRESPLPSQSQIFGDDESSIVGGIPDELNEFVEIGSAKRGRSGVRRRRRMSTPSPTSSARRCRISNRSPGHPVYLSTPVARRSPSPENGAVFVPDDPQPSTSRGFGARPARPVFYYCSDDD